MIRKRNPPAALRPARIPAAGANGEVKPPVQDGKKKPDGPKPLQEDVTNLLPNDTQVVLNLPVEHLFGNGKVNQAAAQDARRVP